VAGPVKQRGKRVVAMLGDQNLNSNCPEFGQEDRWKLSESRYICDFFNLSNVA